MAREWEIIPRFPRIRGEESTFGLCSWSGASKILRLGVSICVVANSSGFIPLKGEIIIVGEAEDIFVEVGLLGCFPIEVVLFVFI